MPQGAHHFCRVSESSRHRGFPLQRRGRHGGLLSPLASHNTLHSSLDYAFEVRLDTPVQLRNAPTQTHVHVGRLFSGPGHGCAQAQAERAKTQPRWAKPPPPSPPDLVKWGKEPSAAAVKACTRTG